MPCTPLDLQTPDVEPSLGLPGYGKPHALKGKDIVTYPSEFPENLLEILDKLQLLLPPGAIKPALNPNYGKDVFDAIMKLLDQFFPFLMLYKFFLPVLGLIVCIIEVLCSLMNPFKLVSAIRRLFRNCIPAFLNIFPVFALIIMIISILLLVLALIEYLVSQVNKLVGVLLRNISALNNAFIEGNAQAVSSVTKKLGAVLCAFQNLFVLLSIFNIIIQVIRDILAIAMAIPPCEEGDSGDASKCCTPDVCPAIIKNGNYIRTTGTFKYLNKVSIEPTFNPPPTIPGVFNVEIRPETWQLFDENQATAQKFINIVDSYDVTISPKPVFFPTDAVYNANTVVKQAPYTVDLKMYYDPFAWLRGVGQSKYIIFKDCIVTYAPTTNLKIYNNFTELVNSGVFLLAGGKGYEEDGVTPLTGFAADGVTPIAAQATLENFIHMAPIANANPQLDPSDGYQFNSIEYTFKPNMEVMVKKQIITSACEPGLAFDRTFINDVAFSGLALKTTALKTLVNPGQTSSVGFSGETATFPDIEASQQCLSTALTALSTNLTNDGVADFQSTVDLCLNKLKDDTNSTLSALMSIGFEACKSDFSVAPTSQFTTQPIQISVNLKEKTGLPLTTNIPESLASNLATKIKAFATFGEVGSFSYDGSQSFTASLTSKAAGSGQLMISFDNNIFCTDTIPEDIDQQSTHTLQTIDYNFIYTSSAPSSVGSEGSSSPRRDESDQSNEIRGSE